VPRIFDNISEKLQVALIESLQTARRADFCVGYFNLRGWRLLAPAVECLTGDGEQPPCRLLIGMHRPPEDEIRTLFGRKTDEPVELDAPSARRLKTEIVSRFHEQLTIGAPNATDEQGLRLLAQHLRDGRVQIKLFLRYPLHAKLYLAHRDDRVTPIHAFLGSSNLTLAGLRNQGELNTEVVDYQATAALADWFEARWEDDRCLDVTQDLIDVIETSWARETLIPPYYIYLKMIRTIAQEALESTDDEQFQLPKKFKNLLFNYQASAVQIAAHHLHKRGGVMLGDVVGLGKTLMATAVARIFQEDSGANTLILCPPNLVAMWEWHRQEYDLIATVKSTGTIDEAFLSERRYRLVIIDESHNFRNSEGRRWALLRSYIQQNESRVILLSATPYNKLFTDLGDQLRLFLTDDQDLGIRPEAYIRSLGGEAEYTYKHMTPIRSIGAFKHSTFADDWRDLMRLYLVRRTRSFIIDTYAQRDESHRPYLQSHNGTRNYFPERIPKTLTYQLNAQDERLLSEDVVVYLSDLRLPRYGLGLYVDETARIEATPAEAETLKNLARAGQRLIGFCRTNLYKRLESSGASFLQSIERHLLRNYLYLYAIENGLELPIGTLDAKMLDASFNDEDTDEVPEGVEAYPDWEAQAQAAYNALRLTKSGYKWVSSALFTDGLAAAIRADNDLLHAVLTHCGRWDVRQDTKLAALTQLLTEWHPDDKVLIFSQFADTVDYLERHLTARGLTHLAGVTANVANPTTYAYRFSPTSNLQRNFIAPDDELRVLLATDVLSEGQNLQDCAIVVNFDLPWAIIRLSQRAGRVDRIGQKEDVVYCYSFLPADGVEKLIHLRKRVSERLKQNSQVVGSDERFFDDDEANTMLRDLFTEKSGLLDDLADDESDLSSRALGIWQRAIKGNPGLQKAVEDLPNVVFSTKAYQPRNGFADGVITYTRTAHGTDALVWMDGSGQSVTESMSAILNAAACSPREPALERRADHFDLLQAALDMIERENQSGVGQLGKPTSVRRKVYDRLALYLQHLRDTAPLFVPAGLEQTVEDILKHPLTTQAEQTLKRQLKLRAENDALAQVAIWLRDGGFLSVLYDTTDQADPPEIICSLGLKTDAS
jgi:superfamily II DNA or RNA helicase/HKD family nuclease